MQYSQPMLVDATFLLLAFFLTVFVIFGLLHSGLAWRIAVDEPNHRSLHDRPVPRIGGVAIIFALLITWFLMWPRSDLLVPLLALLLGVVSYLDDRIGLPVMLRFGAHLVAAAIYMVYGFGSPTPLAILTGVMVIAWMTNLYNFMDGANGLAGGMTLIGFAAYGLAATSDTSMVSFCFAVSAAATGFLLFNFKPARVFMGDAGSIPIGFLAAAIGLSGWHEGIWPWWFPLVVFSPFILDATVTLLRRALRSEPIWRAHREHYDQRLLRMGWSHERLASVEYLLMILAATLALTVIRAAEAIQIAMLSGWFVILLVLMVIIDRKWNAHITKAGE